MAGIFKAYDIRGLFPNEINKDFAKRVGFSISKLFNSKKVLICMDVRLGSEEVKQGLIQGFLNANPETIFLDAGITTTPMCYYILDRDGFDFGIMITASHNPKEYCGLKLLKKKDGLIQSVNHNSDLPMIEDYFNNHKNIELNDVELNNIKQKDFTKDYLEYLSKLSKIESFIPAQEINNVKIVCDFSNGCSTIYSDLLEKTATLIPLNNIQDGNFPAHQPNPLLKESQKELSQKIIDSNADFGIIFDGDADRIVFLDEKGTKVEVGKIFYFIVREMLRENENVKNVVYPINMSRHLEELFNKLGVNSIITRIGFPFIWAKEREHDASFGAELSCHFSFKEMGYRDSSILTYLYIIKAYRNYKKKFSELMAEIDLETYTDEHVIKINSEEESLYLLDKSYSFYKDKCDSYNAIDGHTFYFKDYRFNIRKSNTMPEVKITIESANPEEDKRLFDEIESNLT